MSIYNFFVAKNILNIENDKINTNSIYCNFYIYIYIQTGVSKLYFRNIKAVRADLNM